MIYLKRFDSHSEYSEYTTSENMVKPNVSRCDEEKHVHYNPIPHDYSKDYLTIESLENGTTIYFKGNSTSNTKTISASTDNGVTWSEYTSSTGGSGTTIATLFRGKKILIKGENAQYGSYPSSKFMVSGQFEVKGNIMSLISGDSFENANTLISGSTFASMFSNNPSLVSAENLILPSTTTSYCYQNMLSNCKNLTTAPKLPATNLSCET